jgi:benzil reductase ((S)-benzoin forming)
MMANHFYIITGASSGLGAELSRQLLSEENNIVCLSRTENNDIKISAQDSGCRYKFYSIDLTHVEALNLILQEIFATIDPRSIQTITLINNAAIVAPIMDIQNCTQEEILSNIQLNLSTPILLTSSFIKLTSKWDVKRNVVNISSGSGQYPARSMSLYCSTKSALDMFSRCVGLEQADAANPVHVFAVDPGMMDTGMQKIARDSDFELSEYFSRQKEEGNLSKPDEVARKILSLLKSNSVNFEMPKHD